MTREKPPASFTHDKRSASSTDGACSNSIVTKMTVVGRHRMRDTWCASTGGATDWSDDMKMPTPGMRTMSFEQNSAMNSSSGGVVVMSRSKRRCRPRRQIVMTTKNPAPTKIGTQPPSRNFKRFAPKNGRSNDRNSTSSGSDFHMGHFHVARVTEKKAIDVMPIVPLTAMPYAAARRDDSRNDKTSTMHATASPQLMAGT
jgi:hypothetical protein